MTDDYKDIIYLKYHSSTKHRRLTPKERAAQFAPFAALSGYENSIKNEQIKVENKYNSEKLDDVEYT